MRISTSTGRSCRNAVKLFCGQIKRTQVTKHVGCTEALNSCQCCALVALKQAACVHSKSYCSHGESEVKTSATEAVNGPGLALQSVFWI